MYAYTAHGLEIHSELELPELVPVQPRQPDVVISYGEAPVALSNPQDRGVLYQAQPCRFLLRLEGIANYLVTNGTTITIEPAPASDITELRVFLLGSAFGALLHQRRLVPLHGSAVATPWGAIVFVGDSGMGKSTLAAAFYQQGYRLLSDDVCVVRIESGVPVVYPAYPGLYLWTDMLKQLDADASPRRKRPGLEKYWVPATQRFATNGVPLRAVFELTMTNTEELSLSPYAHGDKLAVLVNHTYRIRFLNGFGLRGEHFLQASLIAHQVPILQVRRPQEPVCLEALVALIESNMRLTVM